MRGWTNKKDAFFAHNPHSPLTDEQKQGFQGLEYYPENPDLQLEVEIEQFPIRDEVQIQTSTGEMQIYSRLGKFDFLVEGEKAQLTIFYNENGYFLPFVDALAGEETYPAGRYLEMEPLADGKFLAEPVFNQPGFVSAEIDLRKAISQAMTLDVTGHYSRTDIFTLQVDTTPQTNINLNEDKIL